MLVDLEKAVMLILDQQIVAVPTETVYGLAADATSNIACQRIYDAKQRPTFNPLIIHVANLEQARKYAKFNDDAIKLAEFFWPGPLTLILPRIESDISEFATSKLDTIAIRVPDNKIFQEVLAKTNKPLAAPSANVSSRISPSLAEHVNKSFLGKVPVVDGGKTLYGIESTIIDCTAKEPALLRYGFITEEVVSDLLGKSVKVGTTSEKINAPGLLKKHYSPNCNLRINVSKAEPDEVSINFGDSNLVSAKNFNLSPTGNLTEAAANLYSMLQSAEDFVRWDKLAGIAVAQVPNEKLGLAINDKLNRASYKT